MHYVEALQGYMITISDEDGWVLKGSAAADLFGVATEF
jgi:hypothetical protein